MKKLFALLILFTLAFSFNTTFAQEEGEAMDPAMMQAWQE